MGNGFASERRGLQASVPEHLDVLRIQALLRPRIAPALQTRDRSQELFNAASS